MAVQQSRSMAFLMLLAALIIVLPLVHSDPIHDLLRNNGLPAGLLPKAVKSYNLHENGLLEVFLDRPCLAKFEDRVYFDSVVKGNLSYGALAGLEGLSQKELFLWLPIKGIIVDDPSSGVILFDIGVAHKQLSLSLFDDPPDCEPKSYGTLSLRSGVLDSRMEKGFEAQR
ncbi:uncharacterized protein LOC122070056 [Macadamia integrifolia]|uniref:uncharacterized protein LOC122070056 n=1 Tax=Macadamia integrifolia TaxID=60698 RepID=UPI001C5001AC|nr:uncharacterized protein LOC122070056 [Macadamia integrifolia]